MVGDFFEYRIEIKDDDVVESSEPILYVDFNNIGRMLGNVTERDFEENKSVYRTRIAFNYGYVFDPYVNVNPYVNMNRKEFVKTADIWYGV